MSDFTSASFYGDDNTGDLRGPKGEKGDDGRQGDIGPQGPTGKSNYEIWIEAGNSGTPADFLAAQKGGKGDKGDVGDDGKSSYDLWIEAGNTGTPADFLASLKGDTGPQGPTRYRYAAVAEAEIQANEVLCRVIATATHTLAANLAGCAAGAEVPPAANWVATLQDDGVPIGTITIATTGAVTLATTGGTAKTIAAGSVIKLIAPAASDTAIAGFAAVFDAAMA